MEKLKHIETDAVQVTKHDHPVFFDTKTVPWTPWVMEGTWFKLLRVDPKTGGFTMLLKVDAGIKAPIHGHLGAVEAYVIQGEFGYDDDRGGVDSYVYEEAGSIHTPDSPGGTTMFAVIHGPLAGYNADGSVAAVVDGKLMYELARKNGAADHIREAY